MNRQELISALFDQMYSSGARHRGGHGDRSNFWFVLNFLYAHREEVCTPGDLRAALDVTTARVTAILNDMESKELILRRPAADDRRRVLIRLTEPGIAFLQNHRQEKEKSIERLIALVGEEDAAAYLRVSRAIDSVRR